MNLTLIVLALTIALFLGMVGLLELGRRLGAARHTREPEGLAKGGGAAEAAVFGLLGLLIAFTFSGAAARFQDRKDLITQEANAIGTAWLRLDLTPPEGQPELRQLFRRYLDARLSAYENVGDEKATQARLDESTKLQGEIWARALKATASPGAAREAGMLLLPAMNEMFDITTTRVMASRNHPPAAIFLLLGAMSLVSALLIGYENASVRRRTWVHPLAFAVVLSLCVYVIMDLEFPRLGLIQVRDADRILVELRASMR
jgi:hypothetical protein